jgi:hypothetical protein
MEPEHSSNSSASPWVLLEGLPSDSTTSNIAWSYNTNSDPAATRSSARDTPSASDRSASHGLAPTPIENDGSSLYLLAGGIIGEHQQGQTRNADSFAELFNQETNVSDNSWVDTSGPWSLGQANFAIADETSLLGMNPQAAEFSDSNGAARHNDRIMNPASTLSLTPSSRHSKSQQQNSSASSLEPSRSPSAVNQRAVSLSYEYAPNDLFDVDRFHGVADVEPRDCFLGVDNLFPVYRQASRDAVAALMQENALEAPTEHAKRTKAKRKRLDAGQKQKVRRVRRLGACLRCRKYREPVRNAPTPNFRLTGFQCDESTPCGSCTRRATSATLFKQPCYRESLDNVVAFRLGMSLQQ